MNHFYMPFFSTPTCHVDTKTPLVPFTSSSIVTTAGNEKAQSKYMHDRFPTVTSPGSTKNVPGTMYTSCSQARLPLPSDKVQIDEKEHKRRRDTISRVRKRIDTTT